MMGLWDLGGMAQALPEIFGAKVALVPLDPGPYGAEAAHPRLAAAMAWGAGYGNVPGCNGFTFFRGAAHGALSYKVKCIRQMHTRGP